MLCGMENEEVTKICVRYTMLNALQTKAHINDIVLCSVYDDSDSVCCRL